MAVPRACLRGIAGSSIPGHSHGKLGIDCPVASSRRKRSQTPACEDQKVRFRFLSSQQPAFLTRDTFKLWSILYSSRLRLESQTKEAGLYDDSDELQRATSQYLMRQCGRLPPFSPLIPHTEMATLPQYPGDDQPSTVTSSVPSHSIPGTSSDHESDTLRTRARTRTSMACTRCRSRKIRCVPADDGSQPCKTCVSTRAKDPCIFTHVNSARCPSRALLSRRAPSDEIEQRSLLPSQMAQSSVPATSHPSSLAGWQFPIHTEDWRETPPVGSTRSTQYPDLTGMSPPSSSPPMIFGWTYAPTYMTAHGIAQADVDAAAPAISSEAATEETGSSSFVTGRP